jgi:predicted nucleotidyltransferase
MGATLACVVEDTFPSEAIRTIEGQSAVEMAVLFGSMATGKAGPRSDVDIGVVCVAGGSLSWNERFDLALDLERSLHREVDLVVLDEATPLLRLEAARGRCLYERRPLGLRRFRSPRALGIRRRAAWW